MKKLLKNSISAICIFALLLSGSSMVFAAEQNDGITTPFASGQDADESDTVTIDGVTYKFIESSVDGMEITRIINLTDDTEEILYYEKETGKFFLNDIQIAYVESITSEENSSPKTEITALSTTSWKYHDTTNTRISWVKGVSAAVLAGVIAAVIPNVGKVTVILKIGLSALSVVAAACAGAVVKCVSYTQTLSNGSVQVRCDWTFKPNSGDVYGPYSTYYT